MLNVWMCCDAEKTITLTVPHSGQLPLPLQFINSDIYIRPSNWSMQWCLAPARWQMVTKSAEPYDCDCSCDMLGGPSNAYRCCHVSLKQPSLVSFHVLVWIDWKLGCGQWSFALLLVCLNQIGHIQSVLLNFYIQHSLPSVDLSPSTVYVIPEHTVSMLLVITVRL